MPEHKNSPNPEKKAAPTTEPPKSTNLDEPAENILARKERERAKEEEEAQAKLERENVFFMSCPHNGQHHGIYFTCDPRGKVIEPHMWKSIYHEPDKPWTVAEIFCQECFLTGNSRKVFLRLTPIRQRDGQVFFTIPDRVAMKMVQYDSRERVRGTTEGIKERAIERELKKDQEVSHAS